MSNGDPTKYAIIDELFDIDDFALWMALQCRKNKIEKHIMDGNKKNQGSWDDLEKLYNK